MVSSAAWPYIGYFTQHQNVQLERLKLEHLRTSVQPVRHATRSSLLRYRRYHVSIILCTAKTVCYHEFTVRRPCIFWHTTPCQCTQYALSDVLYASIATLSLSGNSSTLNRFHSFFLQADPHTSKYGRVSTRQLPFVQFLAWLVEAFLARPGRKETARGKRRQHLNPSKESTLSTARNMMQEKKHINSEFLSTIFWIWKRLEKPWLNHEVRGA